MIGRWATSIALTITLSLTARAEDARRSSDGSGMVGTSAYGIVQYELDTPSSVIFVLRVEGIFSDTYTVWRTICGGDFTTLFAGQGNSPEAAIENSRIKGNGGLSLNGTGDDAPKLACAAAGAVPRKPVVVRGKR